MRNNNERESAYQCWLKTLTRDEANAIDVCLKYGEIGGIVGWSGADQEIKDLILSIKKKASNLGYGHNDLYSDIQRVLSDYERKMSWKVQIV